MKAKDKIWSCTNCYCSIHLHCIQKWANDSMNQKRMHHESQPAGYYSNAGVFIPKKEIIIGWDCPQCRHSYGRHEVPRQYVRKQNSSRASKNYFFCILVVLLWKRARSTRPAVHRSSFMRRDLQQAAESCLWSSLRSALSSRSVPSMRANIAHQMLVQSIGSQNDSMLAAKVVVRQEVREIFTLQALVHRNLPRVLPAV